jgi:hypothetical protein
MRWQVQVQRQVQRRVNATANEQQQQVQQQIRGFFTAFRMTAWVGWAATVLGESESPVVARAFALLGGALSGGVCLVMR